MINLAKYKSIFNVVDTNDVFAHLPSVKSGWGKYGWNMISSGNYDKCKDVVDTYSRVFNDSSSKRDDIDSNLFIYLYTAWEYNDLDNDTKFFDGMQKNQGQRFSTFYNKYYAHYKDLEKNHSIKNYYSLCKKIRPDHMTVGDGWVDIKASSNYISMPQALETMGKWYCNNVYTYDPYSTTDFTRDGNPVTFSGRFQYDYDKASQNAKRDRDMRVERYNNEHPDAQYKIENFTSINDYKLDLETFIGNRGAHALYACDNLNDSCYAKYKNVADDCSAFTLAVMYYATKGAMDEYDSLDIYELGGGALYSVETGIDIYDDLKIVGYEKIPVKNGTYDELESGDILVASNHYEFYYVDSSGKRTSFGWGSVKDKFPNKNCSLKEVPGQPYFHCAGFGNKEFKYIYRLR